MTPSFEVFELSDFTFDVYGTDDFSLAVPESPALAERSPQWRAVAKAAVAAHPFCAVCKCRTELQVHHVKPFHLFPELELDRGNLVVMCRPHHFLFGHLCDWRSVNPNVRADVAVWSDRLARRNLNPES